MLSTTTPRKIFRYKNDQITSEEDIVVKESPLTVCCNNIQIATLLCTPDYEKELAVGFLITSGLIKDREKLGAIIHEEEENSIFVKYTEEKDKQNLVLKRYMTTGCGMGMLLSSEEEIAATEKYKGTVTLAVEDIINIMKELQHKSELYLTTGGVHSAALSDGKEIITFREDIGRHNAVDKIIGYAFLNNINLADKVLITSGRISSEIVLKLAKVGIGVIISRSAPMDRAIEYAQEFNMTIIGFARGRRMNIYTAEERVKNIKK